MEGQTHTLTDNIIYINYIIECERVEDTSALWLDTWSALYVIHSICFLHRTLVHPIDKLVAYCIVYFYDAHMFCLQFIIC